MIEPTLLSFAGVVFLAYAVQTVTGFGSMLLCVTFGAHLLVVRDLLTLAVPISLLQAGYIVVRHGGAIERPLLLRRVLPLMGAGLGLGFLAFHTNLIGGPWLVRGFGLLVLGLAARELWRLRRPAGEEQPAPKAPPSPVAAFGAMLGAGVIHGIYATGGPLLVYALGREELDKHQFRSTLAAVWLTLNAALLIGFLSEGRYGAGTGQQLLVLLPAVPLGIVLGEWLHARVDERRFKLTVFSLLIAAALSLLLR